jgi:hypothetical protein
MICAHVTVLRSCVPADGQAFSREPRRSDSTAGRGRLLQCRATRVRSIADGPQGRASMSVFEFLLALYAIIAGIGVSFLSKPIG